MSNRIRNSIFLGRSAVAAIACITFLHSIPAFADLFVSPQGAGSKDGSTWQNALDGRAGLQASWDALQPGQTLWVGSGDYSGGKLTIGSGGKEGQLKTISGKDTGGGLPTFTGTFKKDNPARTGSTFVTLSNGSDYWQVRDIRLRDFNIGIASRDGGHQGARIHNFDVTGCREGISLAGGGTAEKPELGSHDIEISDCEFVHYTKRGIRLKNGNYNLKITNCVADAGGKEWATEPFHMGYDIIGDDAARESKKPGAHDHDITFTRCVAMNSYHDNGAGYWNADGFCAERGVTNLRFINCMAFDNTDGGWDTKADNVTLEGCISMGNKRNYRFWGTTKLTRCLGAYSVYPGGSGGDLGMWASGDITIEQSTFWDNGANLETDHGGKISLTNSILAMDKSRAGAVSRGEAEGVKTVDCVVWDEAKGQGENPQLVNPSPQWEGQGDAFNSKKFGPAKGYFNSAPAAEPLPFHRALFIVPGEHGQVAKAPAKVEPAVVTVPKTPEQIAQEAAQMPILENAGFEADLSGWAKAAAPIFQLKTEGAAQGQKYVSITAEKRVEATRRIGGLVPGQAYILSYQSRGNTSKDARFILRNLGNGQYLTLGRFSDTLDWKKTALKFTAPAAEIGIELSVRSAGTLDLDDLVIERAK